jgi:DMSO/TMAO reductase YedYZ molybdopterin-dependent catalytic subunit
MTPGDESKRRFILGAGSLGALLLTGCDRLSETEWFPKVLRTHETLSRGVHKLLGSRPSMAQEFTEADLSPFFRSNGTSMPEGEEYQALAKNGFANWQLEVSGLVEKPAKLSLAELRAMPRRTQITRHDCVEGWSAIGKWTGTPLREFLRRVGADTHAKYVWFRCAEGYSSSIDMATALHPQTQMTFRFDGEILPPRYGFPLRIRMPTKLGFKNPKHVMELAVTNKYLGGYWEDQGYNWFSGN